MREGRRPKKGSTDADSDSESDSGSDVSDAASSPEDFEARKSDDKRYMTRSEAALGEEAAGETGGSIDKGTFLQVKEEDAQEVKGEEFGKCSDQAATNTSKSKRDGGKHFMKGCNISEDCSTKSTIDKTAYSGKHKSDGKDSGKTMGNGKAATDAKGMVEEDVRILNIKGRTPDSDKAKTLREELRSLQRSKTVARAGHSRTLSPERRRQAT